MLNSKPIKNMPLNYTFEDYLKDIHQEENPTVLDDDLSDSYESWLCDIDLENIIKMADDFANKFRPDYEN